MSCPSRDWCGPIVSALVKSRYIAFSEGWALYAESPLIAIETGKTQFTYICPINKSSKFQFTCLYVRLGILKLTNNPSRLMHDKQEDILSFLYKS